MPYNEEGESVPRRRQILHYHGDNVRVLFLFAAVVLIVAESTGADLPLSPTIAVMTAVVLVVCAGVANPAQRGIHWVNGLLSILGTFVFGTAAVDYYRSGFSLSEPSFLFVEVLALLSLIALYFSTRTIRGLHLKADFV